MKDSKNQQIFLELLRAGLWGGDQRSVQEFNVQEFKDVDWNYIYQLAQEQSVQGLVLQGLEWFIEQGTISKDDIPQELLLQWIGEVQIIEQQNIAMNEFVAWLIELLRKEDIYTLLVKGQGIAQCYEKPLWRSCGDVDLLLDKANYVNAKACLSDIAEEVDGENPFDSHFSVLLKGWEVELHGSLRSMLTKRADNLTDVIQEDVFVKERNRVWNYNGTTVLLPCPDDDVIFVFTHILKHFFHYGIGLRQICDWCRLLWTCRDSLNHGLLESRIQKMRLMTEWKAFAALAVDYLGMTAEAMPLLDSSNVQEFKKYKKKAERICKFVLDVGNFGHNRDNIRYKNSNFFFIKSGSLCRHTCDSLRQSFIFPVDSLIIWGRMFVFGIGDALKGK